jgi:hypothetical protein
MCVGFMRLKWGDCARREIRVNLSLHEWRDLGARGAEGGVSEFRCSRVLEGLGAAVAARGWGA